MKKENTIDLLKLVFSLLIVAIHVPICIGNQSAYNGLITNGIARIGVPFFFISSSYFLFKKTNINPQNPNIKSYFLKLLRLYCIWSVIYLPFKLFSSISKGINLWEFSVSQIHNFLFNGISFHLWYLNTTIVCTLIFIILLKTKANKLILPFSILFYICGLLCNTYHGLISNLFNESFYKIFDVIIKYTYSTNYSFPLFWMIFIYIGYLFANNKISINKNLCFILLPISIILLYSELLFVDSHKLFYGHSISLGILLSSILIFSLSLNINIKDKNSYIYIRHLSTLIYLIHPLILNITSFLLDMMKISIQISGVNYVIVAILSTLCSYIIIFFANSKKKIFKKFAYLYK